MTSTDAVTLRRKPYNTGMGKEQAVEGSFVFVREVNEYPDGSIRAVQ
jgi:hypothetical protein